MEDLKSLVGGLAENNIIYIISCFLLVYVGIRITRKAIKFIMGIIFLVYTLIKFAISSNLINFATLIK